MGHISTDHNSTAAPTTTGAAAVTEGTHHTTHPTITGGHVTLWLTNASITTHAATHPTGIFVPHFKHATSPTDVAHATFPQTIASLAPATLTALHRDHSQ